MTAQAYTLVPGARSLGEALREFWDSRELLFILAARDIKARYRQTLLGVGWALFQPLYTVAIASGIFGYMAKIPSDGVPYPLFSFAAVLPWLLFSKAVSGASFSLTGNSSLVTRVYLPRMILPAAGVLSTGADFAVGFGGLILLQWYFGFFPTLGGILVSLALTVWLMITAFGVGLLLSAFQVRFRDIGYAIGFLLQGWMLVTPVVFSLSLVPPHWYWLVVMNPAAGPVHGFRSALLGVPWDGTALLASVAVTCVLLAVGMMVFRTAERVFADII